MPFSKLTASQLIHNVIRKHKPPSFWERLFGQKMCVVVTKTHFDANPATMWWALIKRSDSVGLVQLKVLGETIAKLSGLLPTPSLGFSSPIADGASDASSLDHETAKIFGQLDGAWKAGMWAAAQKAGEEFAIGVAPDSFVIGGPATFTEQGEQITVKLLPYNEYRSTFMSFMAQAERQGEHKESQYTAGLMQATGVLTYVFHPKAGTLQAVS